MPESQVFPRLFGQRTGPVTFVLPGNWKRGMVACPGVGIGVGSRPFREIHHFRSSIFVKALTQIQVILKLGCNPRYMMIYVRF